MMIEIDGIGLLPFLDHRRDLGPESPISRAFVNALRTPGRSTTKRSCAAWSSMQAARGDALT